MADILTTIGVDDTAARSALRDYKRFADTSARDISSSFGMMEPSGMIARMAGTAARGFLGFQAMKRAVHELRDAHREYVSESLDAESRVARFQAAHHRAAVEIGMDLERVVGYWRGEGTAALDSFVNGFHGAFDAVVDSINMSPGVSEKYRDLQRTSLGQEHLASEMKAAAADRRQIMLEQELLSTDQYQREMAQENERNRANKTAIVVKYKELSVVDDLLERERFRHYLAVQRVEEAEKEREATERIKLAAIAMGPVSARAEAAMQLAGVAGGVEEQTAAARDSLLVGYRAERAGVEADPALKTLEREARLSALDEVFAIRDRGLQEVSEARSQRVAEEADRQLQLDRVRLEIQAKRLDGLEDEADIAELLVSYHERMRRIADSGSLSASDKAPLLSELRSQRDMAMLLSETKRDRASVDGTRAAVFVGGTFGASGRDVLRLGLGGQGRGDGERNTQRIADSTGRLERIVEEIGRKLGQIPGFSWQ